MNHSLIEIKALRKSFQGHEVLRGVDLTVPEGGITLIIGKSGEGKSVLLKHIVGLLQPDSGEVLFQGRPLTRMRRSERGVLARSMSFMFQNMALFDSLTVFENIALPLREKTRLPERDIAARVMAIVDHLELGPVRDKYPSQISGGMQKRVALARALVNEPKVVLFDEPTTGLDPIRKNAVLSLIAQSRKTFGFTALMVSHDIPDVFRIAAKVAMLDAGRIVFTGTPEETLASEMPVVARFLAGEEDPPADMEEAS
ncbi:ABC transporter ATP-binding protein [Desulfolutivibrio sulfoxidireducens]|uniref:ABC transporter ATP-binding protein n=1 Tax=Desulfolutivibrio sulfoxidireducens TaxID=2773299 RepID=UPI00159D0ABC|nr:ATP-binding cassette domain-containing protein [Desulfolutivibrio sulfoxidireducens]QLA17170.1 ATP-binding cassette domain-containing protein [Desulfolutivibrio sulfoxidireducens]